MKKLLALFLTLIISFSCTACGGSATSGEGVIKGCIESLKQLEIGKALSYVEDTEDLVKALPFDNLDSAIAFAEDMLPVIEEVADVEIPKSFINVAKKQTKNYSKLIADCIDYKITDEDKDGDDITYTVEFSFPNPEEIGENLDQKKARKIATKYSDDLMGMQDIEDIADIDAKVINNMLNDFHIIIKDAIKKTDKMDFEVEIIVTKDGGKYYISRDNAFLEGLDEAEEALEQFGDIKDMDSDELMELMEMMM